MFLTPSEFNEIKSINKKEELFWEEFKPYEKSSFSDCGLITVWYLPKIIKHIEYLENELIAAIPDKPLNYPSDDSDSDPCSSETRGK